MLILLDVSMNGRISITIYYIYILAVGKYQKMNKMHLVSVSSLERQRMEYQ